MNEVVTILTSASRHSLVKSFCGPDLTKQNFSIGKPTSGYTKVKPGVGYKEHKQGFIAYNLTNKSQKITRANGQKHQVEAKSGLFCKDVGSKAECLSVD
jgi:hypothetical protein